jgi:four helix bundle protein
VRRAHKQLDVWKESVELATSIYNVTGQFPKSEMYGLTAQMRRAAVSVPSNIAEGAARTSRREFVQFLRISGGSLSELDTQLVIASRLGYLSSEDCRALTAKMDSIAAKLAGLIASIRTRLEDKNDEG